MARVDAVLSEADRAEAEVLAPVNREGDVEGCTFDATPARCNTACPRVPELKGLICGAARKNRTSDLTLTKVTFYLSRTFRSFPQ